MVAAQALAKIDAEWTKGILAEQRIERGRAFDRSAGQRSEFFRDEAAALSAAAAGAFGAGHDHEPEGKPPAGNSGDGSERRRGAFASRACIPGASWISG